LNTVHTQRRWHVYVAFICSLVFAVACGSNPTPQTFILQVYDTPDASGGVATNGTAAFTPAPPRNNESGAVPTLSAAAAEACSLVRLVPGQHITAGGSYAMSEDDAAGPMACRIERDSCAFTLLTADRDPAIGFSEHKPPPLTLEDRLMHPAMLLPLSRLRDLVQGEWNGDVQLFVAGAYDSTGEQDPIHATMESKVSLHFEGRSIDVITNPPDANKVDRLCALAHCAGFDWVSNESDHCHLSVKAPSLCTICSGVSPHPSVTVSPTITPTVVSR
jgi:Hedgehog amino-terminal signalling domain